MRARSTLRGSHATGAALLPRLQSQHGSPHRYHTVQAAVRILNPNTGSGCVAYTCAAPATSQGGPHTCSYSSMHQVHGVTRTQKRHRHAGNRRCIQQLHSGAEQRCCTEHALLTRWWVKVHSARACHQTEPAAARPHRQCTVAFHSRWLHSCTVSCAYARCERTPIRSGRRSTAHCASAHRVNHLHPLCCYRASGPAQRDLHLCCQHMRAPQCKGPRVSLCRRRHAAGTPSPQFMRTAPARQGDSTQAAACQCAPLRHAQWCYVAVRTC
jgi:hypothetical protein